MDHVPPADIIPELKVAAPPGTVTEVTVCGDESLLVQVLVLLTPMTTVTGSGMNHCVELGFPEPFSIETGSAFAGVALLEVVLADEVEDAALVELVAPTVPDPATTIMVPTIVVGCTEQK
jgi:hypothetical protein